MIGRGRERQPNRKSLRPQSQAGSSGRAIERQRKRERTSTACKQCLSALLSPDNCRSDTGAYYVFYYAFCARTTTTSRMGYSNNHRQSKKAEKQTQTQRPFCGQQQYSVQSDNSNNNSKVQFASSAKAKGKKQRSTCMCNASLCCVCVCMQHMWRNRDRHRVGVQLREYECQCECKCEWEGECLSECSLTTLGWLALQLHTHTHKQVYTLRTCMQIHVDTA